MRGLRKYLTPFAPDQSGAVSVLYELGGIIVICDAGGCAGNVCGFDEPRWFEQKSAVFSAGLRDMDAILGRDDRLVAKLVDAAVKVEAGFAAIIGTPVPAVIGTDHQALRRMCEKKTDLPVLAVNTNTILIANQLSVSTDRKSLYAKVRYSLSQRSITTFYHFGFNGYPYGTENITEEELSTAYYLNKNNLGEHKNPNAWNARNSAVQSNKEKIMVSGH